VSRPDAQQLEDLLARLERERVEAERRRPRPAIY